MISNASLFTSAGFSAWNSGLKPLKSTVRSSAGCGLRERDLARAA